MCCVGVKKNIFRKVKILTANLGKSKKITTSDSCCLLINKEHNLLFDTALFDEYHMYIEDYCAQIKYKLNLNIYTLRIKWIWVENQKDFFYQYPNSQNWFIHHSHTFTKKGAKWGKWNYYKKILNNKWQKKIITT